MKDEFLAYLELPTNGLKDPKTPSEFPDFAVPAIWKSPVFNMDFRTFFILSKFLEGWGAGAGH